MLVAGRGGVDACRGSDGIAPQRAFIKIKLIKNCSARKRQKAEQRKNQKHTNDKRNANRNNHKLRSNIEHLENANVIK